jgi:hypothetical protein
MPFAGTNRPAENKHYNMARKSKKTIDIGSATVADGSLKPFRSVYELAGIKNVSYWEKTFAAYQSKIRSMNLLELHDHGFTIGVPAGATKDIMIDRLERKFLQENPHERDAYLKARDEGKKDEGDLSVEERAALIMQRGR